MCLFYSYFLPFILFLNFISSLFTWRFPGRRALWLCSNVWKGVVAGLAYMFEAESNLPCRPFCEPHLASSMLPHPDPDSVQLNSYVAALSSPWNLHGIHYRRFFLCLLVRRACNLHQKIRTIGMFGAFLSDLGFWGRPIEPSGQSKPSFPVQNFLAFVRFLRALITPVSLFDGPVRS